MRKSILLALIFLFTISLSACNKEESTDVLLYTALEDGTFSVSGYTGDSVKIKIPNEHNGIKVTVIEEKAFENSTIQTIELGENIYVIENSAFKNCYHLKKVCLNNNLEIIEYDAFEGCSLLSDIELPQSLTAISTGVFRNCSSLTKVTIPINITKIDSNTFEGCNKLETVNIPDDLQSISKRAFYDCSKISKITLPDSLSSIGEEAFGNCTNLSSITIPSNVTSVGEDAFINSCHTIYIKGLTTGWNSQWNPLGAELIYENTTENKNEDVVIYEGEYYDNSNIEGITNSYLTVNTKEQQITWTRTVLGIELETTYNYETNGNILHCIPTVNDGSHILDIEYHSDVKAMTFESDGTMLSFVNLW